MSWRTASFLLSRRGSLEFKRLHVAKVLHTPGLSWFPNSFRVFNALLTDELLVQKGFEPEEFMEGAREGYPLVARLMLGLDPEFEGASEFEGDAGDTVGDAQIGGSTALFTRRVANFELKHIVNKQIYDAVMSTMALAKESGTSWEMQRSNVLQAWIHDIRTGTDMDPLLSESSDSSDSSDSSSSSSSSSSSLVESKFCRVAVSYIVDESYILTDPRLSEEPIQSDRVAPHTWVFESRGRPLQQVQQLLQQRQSSGDASSSFGGSFDGAAAAGAVSFALSLPRPIGLTVEEGSEEGLGIRVAAVKPGGAADQLRLKQQQQQEEEEEEKKKGEEEKEEGKEQQEQQEEVNSDSNSDNNGGDSAVQRFPEEGDHIVGIGGVEVAALPFDDCLGLLDNGRDEISLEFRRAAQQGREEELEVDSEGLVWSDWKIVALEYQK